MKGLLTAIVGVTLIACQGERVGDDCGRFFSNGCKAPLSCVDVDDKKVCGGGCDWLTPENDKPGYGCKSPNLKPIEVQYTRNGAALGSAGCYCVPD